MSKRKLACGQEECDPPTHESEKRKLDEIVDSLNEISLKKESKKLKQCSKHSPKYLSADESGRELEGPEDWESEEEVDVKATKSDDAKVQCFKWNHEVLRTMRVLEWSTSYPALEVVKKWMLLINGMTKY